MDGFIVIAGNNNLVVIAYNMGKENTVLFNGQIVFQSLIDTRITLSQIMYISLKNSE